MSGADDEDFMAPLLERFEQRGSGYGNLPPKETDARRRRETRAAQTAAQRARRGPPTRQLNFRATERTRELIAALSEKLALSHAQVIGQAIELLAKKEKIT